MFCADSDLYDAADVGAGRVCQYHYQELQLFDAADAVVGDGAGCVPDYCAPELSVGCEEDESDGNCDGCICCPVGSPHIYPPNI